MNYGKQRESKLMFFLYCLKDNGYNVSNTFEMYIRDTPTDRFSADFDDDYKQLLASIKAEKNIKLKPHAFEIDRDALFFNTFVSLSTRDYKMWNSDSDERLPSHAAIIRRKPDCVPSLDLESIRI